MHRPILLADGRSVVDWLAGRNRLLVVTHERPDGDALGAAFGAAAMLRAAGHQPTVWVRETIPAAYTWMAPADLVIGEAVDLTAFDGMLCLDSATAPRLAVPHPEGFAGIDLPTCNVDHHLDNPGYGDVALVETRCAATCEILALLARSQDLALPAEAATRLLLGIYTDTGGFRHRNTDSTALGCAAWLMEQGADHDQVIKAAFYSESLGMLRLKAHILDSFKVALDGRLAYFIITPELLDRCGVKSRDTEDLVDVLRPLAGTDFVVRLQEVSDGVRFSFRSMNPSLPVIGIAHRFGGGGHALAAGAHAKGIDLATAEELMLRYTEEELRGRQ